MKRVEGKLVVKNFVISSLLKSIVGQNEHLYYQHFFLSNVLKLSRTDHFLRQDFFPDHRNH